jgi:aryl-alcohol dehydrogenase (NADP+)
MMFGPGGNADQSECVRIMNRALDAGVNFVDTADNYASGLSEQIVGEVIKDRREEIVLTTKFSRQVSDNPDHQGRSRRWIVREVENSLRRLNTDYIDVYLLHRRDADADIDDTLSALSDLVHQGKILYIGSSNMLAEHIVEAQWVAERRVRERFRVEEPQYSIFVREIETSVLPTCWKYGFGVMTWSPLNGGMLTGRYRLGQAIAPVGRGKTARIMFDEDRPGAAAKLRLLPRLEKIAAEAGISLTHMALAFVLAHPAVTSAIVGPRTMQQLEDSLGALDLELDTATLAAIDEVVPPGTNADPCENWYWQPPIVYRPAQLLEAMSRVPTEEPASWRGK